jgi:hypothetical protein
MSSHGNTFALFTALAYPCVPMLSFLDLSVVVSFSLSSKSFFLESSFFIECVSSYYLPLLRLVIKLFSVSYDN